MIITFVGDVTKQKQFLAEDVISYKLSPLTIVHGERRSDLKKIKLEFGTYIQAFEDKNVTNTNRTVSIDTTALLVTLNKSCEYKFISLSTGRLLHRGPVLPITDNVIARLHELAKTGKQPIIDDDIASIE